MTAHEVTPSPPGAHPIFEALFEGMRTTGLLPAKPQTPVSQPMPAQTPEDRL